MKHSQVGGEKNWRANQNKTPTLLKKKTTSLWCAHSVQIPNALVMMRERGAAPGPRLLLRPKLFQRRKLAYSRNEKSEKTVKLRSTLILAALFPRKFSTRLMPKGRSALSVGWKLREIVECTSPRKSIHLRRLGKKCDVVVISAASAYLPLVTIVTSQCVDNSREYCARLRGHSRMRCRPPSPRAIDIIWDVAANWEHTIFPDDVYILKRGCVGNYENF